MTTEPPNGKPQSGFFAARDGQQLYHEIWTPPGEVRATVVVVHGYGEHCGRYQNTVGALRPRGFELFAFDYRGHGQAGGRRGHIDHFAEYLDDLDRALELARARGPRPLFLLGHSQGGLIAARWVIERGQDLAGLVLSSPFMGLKLKVPALKLAAGRVTSRWLPRTTFKNDLDVKTLSRDPAVGEAYARDRFVHRVATARWFTEMSAAQQRCQEQARAITLPVLVYAGDADAIADPAATRAVFDGIASADKKLTMVPGGYHELMNDTCK
ncbi:MAG: lysophospholipase, partial [Deltaproteobacteria bacterium]|nr:lysophospholipase [Deltaproteobacteria bacterium]